MAKSRTRVALLLVAAGTGLLVGADQLLRGPRDIRRFEYVPGQLTEDGFEALARSHFRVDRLAIGEGVTLRGLVRPPTSPEAPFVLYFAGNGEALLEGSSRFLEVARRERDLGLACFAYRGYDGSGGTPHIAAMESDAEAILAHLHSAYGARAVHLVGFSLGTHFAAWLATRMLERGERPASVALLAPFTRIDVVPKSIFRRWATPDRYDNESLARALADHAMRTLVVHGDRDDALPVEQGHRIAELLGPHGELVVMPGLGHAQILESEETLDLLRARWDGSELH